MVWVQVGLLGQKIRFGSGIFRVGSENSDSFCHVLVCVGGGGGG